MADRNQENRSRTERVVCNSSLRGVEVSSSSVNPHRRAHALLGVLSYQEGSVEEVTVYRPLLTA
jgi:hypothetical protein